MLELGYNSTVIQINSKIVFTHNLVTRFYLLNKRKKKSSDPYDYLNIFYYSVYCVMFVLLMCLWIQVCYYLFS